MAQDATADSRTQAYRVGDRLEVEWKGTWYKAEILETKDGAYKIRYDGFSSAWDEWVQPARMRRNAAAAPTPEKDTAVQDTVTQNSAEQDADPSTPLTTALPKLVPLAPKPGFIMGRAVFANGKPVPNFLATAQGWASEIHLGPSGTIPTLGQDEGSNGRYEFRPTSAFDRTKILPDALVSVVSAEARLTYKGRKYRLPMHPLDGQRAGDSKGGFRGFARKGVLRDFVLKLHGPQIGFEKNTPPRDTDSFGAFYGGRVDFFFKPDDGGIKDPGPFKDATMTLTFKPDGPLLDGSASRTITRTLRIKDDSILKSYSGYFGDIPLGDYTLTATLTNATGASYPMRLRKPGEEYQNSTTIQFLPWEGLWGVVTPRVYATR